MNDARPKIGAVQSDGGASGIRLARVPMDGTDGTEVERQVADALVLTGWTVSLQ